MEQPPKTATLNTVAAIMQAYTDGSLATKPLLALTSAVILLEDVRFDMILKKQDMYQPTVADSPIPLTLLRQVGDYMNELRNTILQADANKYGNGDQQNTAVKPERGMAFTVETNGANLHPLMGELIDLFREIHNSGSLKAIYQTRDELDCPVWTLEVTAPTITLRPLFALRDIKVTAMTARRSGANCVVTATIALML